MKPCRIDLAKAVLKRFSSDFYLSTDSLYFIENSLGISQSDEIMKTFNDPQDPYHYMLIELVFSPDEQAIFYIEPLILKPFSREDVRFVVDYVIDDLTYASVVLPDNKRLFLKINNDVVESFLKKFCLDRSIPETLIDIANKYLCFEDFCIIKYRLRKFSNLLSETHINFFANFFKVFGKNKDLKKYFDLTIDIFYEFKDLKDLYTAFIHKREHFLALLKIAEQSEKMLKELPIEKLMMQKEVIFIINKKEILDKLKTLDYIFEKMFESGCL